MSTSRFFKDLFFSSVVCLAAACSSGSTSTAVGGDGGAAGPSSSGAHKRVFVTSATFTGAINPNSQNSDGTPDGDAACATAAASGGLSGSFKAWLSGIDKGVTNDAASRLTDVGGWYLVGADTLVFSNAAALTAAPAHAIDHDEKGQPVAADVLVWTATTPDGKLAAPSAGGGFCNSWTSESSGNTGVVGTASSTTDWTASPSQATEACSARHSLYCFEQ